MDRRAEVRMMSTSLTRTEHRRLFWETVVCLGPTLIYLPTALLLVPHQLNLALNHGRLSALWTVFYFVGTAALAVAVRAMYVFIRDGGRRLMPALIVRICVGCAVLALSVGPMGTFALGGNLPVYGWLLFVVMPLACVVHLGIQSKRYVWIGFT
jgi:hypothetical protein